MPVRVAAPLDPVARVERDLKRTVWIIVPLTIAGATVGAAQVVFETQLRGATPPWLIPFIAVDMPSSGVIIYWLFRRGNRKTVDFVRGLGPRVRDAGVARGRGVLVVFDNGLVLQLARGQFIFWGFLAADGSALGANTVGEVRRWWRGFHGRRKGSVGPRQKDTLAGAGLDQIRTNLGARWAWLHLFERQGGTAPSPGEPLREAMATFYLPRWSEKADEVKGQVDGIVRLMQESGTMTFPERRPMPGRRG